LTTTSNGQVQPIRKFSNLLITFKLNRNGRFEFESNLEASHVPNIFLAQCAHLTWLCDKIQSTGWQKCEWIINAFAFTQDMYDNRPTEPPIVKR